MLQHFDLFKASSLKCARHNKKVSHIDLNPNASIHILCPDCPEPIITEHVKEIDLIISKQSTNTLSQRLENEITNFANYVDKNLDQEISKLINSISNALNRLRFVLNKNYQNFIEEELTAKCKRSCETLNQILKTFWTNGKIEEDKYFQKYIQTFEEYSSVSEKIKQYRLFCDQILKETELKFKSFKEDMEKKTDELNSMFINRETLIQKMLGIAGGPGPSPKKISLSKKDEEEKYDEQSLEGLSEIRYLKSSFPLIFISKIRNFH